MCALPSVRETDIILDVEPVHDIVEQNLGARGDYYIVILPLAEIERLYLCGYSYPRTR